MGLAKKQKAAFEAYADRFAKLVRSGQAQLAQEQLKAEPWILESGSTFLIGVVARLRDTGQIRAAALALACITVPAILNYVLKRLRIVFEPRDMLLAIVDGLAEEAELEAAARIVLPLLVSRLTPEQLGAVLGADGDERFLNRAETLLAEPSVRLDAMAGMTQYLVSRPDFPPELAQRIPPVLKAAVNVSSGRYDDIQALLSALAPETVSSSDLNARLVRRVMSSFDQQEVRTILDLSVGGRFEYPSVLLSGEEKSDFQHAMIETSPRVGLVKDSLYVAGAGVITPSDKLLTEGLLFNEMNWTKFSGQSRFASLFDQRDPAGQSELLSFPAAVEHVPGRIFPIGCNGNIFHFLVNHLPKLWFDQLLEPYLGRDFTIILDVGENTFHHSFLALLGIGPERVKWIAPGTAVDADEIIVSTMPVFRAVNGPDTPSRVSRVAMREVRRQLHGGEPKARGRRIFLQRGQVSHRRLLNEAEVEAMLERLGFEIVDPSRMSAADQIALMKEVSIVAGVNGAQMALAMYAPTGAAFVDLTPNPTQSLYWFTLPASAQGLRYYEVAGTLAAPTTRPVNASFSVDLTVLERAIVLAESEER